MQRLAEKITVTFTQYKCKWQEVIADFDGPSASCCADIRHRSNNIKFYFT